jgi:putative DNA primase/helicase
MNFLTNACELVQFGWRVFPLGPGLKIPAVPASKGGRGCLDATDDEEQLAAWHRAYPSANVGLACGDASGIIVVDFDPRNGSDDTVKFLASRKQFFPPTVEVRTWSGGRHLYYRWEPEIKNSKSKRGRGIDIKTTGGYVVAPPSWIRDPETKKEGRYEWVRSPLGPELPRLPRWAVEALKVKPQVPVLHKKTNYDGDLEPVLKYIECAPQGQRNNILFWGACRAAESGTEEGNLRGALLTAATNTGLPKVEAEKTIASAFAKAGKL